MTFKELNLDEKLLRALELNNYSEPTTIQEKAIPLLLNNKNLFGKSSTGTGKTASFVLPILQKLDLNKRRIQAIIVTPTRELASQVIEQIKKYGQFMKQLSVCGLIGGSNISQQFRKLRESQIVVGTPGRINDHINRKTLKFDDIQTIILDEADEMLKMGFKYEIDSIFNNSPNDTQKVLFSATTNKKVMEIVETYMKNYEFIEVNNQIKLNDNISNNFIYVKSYSKEELILKVFEVHKPKLAIVFSNTKSNTDRIANNLKTLGIKCGVINGDKKQSQRNSAINAFKKGDTKVLIATDVAARGLDVKGVDYVINYDISIENEHFIHRIGRTGRNNAVGNTISFIQGPKVLRQLKDIEKIYNLNIIELDIEQYGLTKQPQGENRDRDSRGHDSRGGGRSSYGGDRRRSGGFGGDRRSSGSFGDRRSSNSGGDRRSSSSFGDRRSSASFGDKTSESGGDRRRSGGFGGDRRSSSSFGERRSATDFSERRSAENNGGDRRRSGGFGGDRRSKTGRDGFKKQFGNKNFNRD